MPEAIANEASGKETCLNNNKANDCAAHDDPRLSIPGSNAWTPALVPDQFQTPKPTPPQRGTSGGGAIAISADSMTKARHTVRPICLHGASSVAPELRLPRSGRSGPR
jgi:hypothetical protein